MIDFLDTSVIVAALDESDPDHAACRRVLLHGKPGAWAHSLSETFSTLTGGRLGYRVSASETASILSDFVAPRLRLISLADADLIGAYVESEQRGVRGGAIYDFLHLVAARQAGADRMHTLNTGDFQALHRPGDPEITHP